MSDKNTPNITNKEYKEIYNSMSKDMLIELLIADKREIRRLRGMWLEQKQANEANKQPDTKALPLHGVSFSEDCECDNTEVCGICFRKKGYEMIDNKLTLTGETEVCDKCEETFTYAGEYRNICFGCEDDFI